MNRTPALMGALCLAFLTACGGGPIEITGTFDTPFGEETITEQTWASAFSTTTIEDWDNDANWVVTKNPPDAMFNPDTYSKTVWTEEVDGQFHYCVVDFGQPTIEAARTSTRTADASDPDSSGCGGFAWTAMTRK